MVIQLEKEVSYLKHKFYIYSGFIPFPIIKYYYVALLSKKVLSYLGIVINEKWYEIFGFFSYI